LESKVSNDHSIDMHIGTRMRQRRSLLGITQTSLGKAVGVTFQQIQKYERGTNRISASRLFELAAVLDVSVTYFFDGLPVDAACTPTLKARNAPLSGLNENLLSAGETLQLIRAYYILPAAVRRNLFATMRSIATAGVPSTRKRNA
jgi:transcriptional regulator with XRE-family HTH domain